MNDALDRDDAPDHGDALDRDDALDRGDAPVDPPMADYEHAEPPPAPPGPDPVLIQPPPGAASEQRSDLIGVPISTGQAVGSAFALVIITDVAVVIAGLLLSVAEGSPEWLRGLGFGALVALGYSAGLAAAIALTRPRHVRLSVAYGFRGLPSPALAAALGVSLLARLIGLVWGVIIVGLKIKLPGMDIDPTAILPDDPFSVALTFALFTVLAPFAEEVVFRGILQGSLSQRMTPMAANVWTSVLFAVLHFNPFGIVPIFFASLSFGWLFQRTRTLWATVLAHAAFNGIGLLLAYAVKGLPVP